MRRLGIVSYAQNFEDVMLWRALGDIPAGFWIDVGAADPYDMSVTRAFSEHGWHGINVEPGMQAYARLQAARPGDLNLPLALAAAPGMLTFYDCDDPTLSSLDAAVAERNRRAGRPVTLRQIKVSTLAELCRVHAPPDIHFLKIDVEGAEAQVLAGADFAAFRPWVLLVEATLPMSQIPSHAEWEPPLLAAGYRFAWFDGLNRFYVAEEHWERLRHQFVTPPNCFDYFHQADPRADARLAGAEAARAAAEQARQAAEAEGIRAAAAHAAREAEQSAQAAAQSAAATAAAATAAQLRDTLATAKMQLGEAQARLAVLEAGRIAAPRPSGLFRRLLYQLRWFLLTDQRAETAGLRCELGRLAAAVEALQLRP